MLGMHARVNLMELKEIRKIKIEEWKDKSMYE